MLLFDRDSWTGHLRWAIASAAIALAAAIWYIAYGWPRSGGRWEWPSGGSPPAFTFGVIGGLIIVFEVLLWPRKSLRRYRLGRTKHWMMAHLWLGLLVLPLLLLHGGFHFALTRSTLAAVLMWLLVAVVLSGIWGWVLQNILPRIMLEHLPAETIYSQIDHVLGLYSAEAEQIVCITCGQTPEASPGEERAAGRSIGDPSPFLTIGAERKVGRLQGRIVQSVVLTGELPQTEPLWRFYNEQIRSYLQPGSKHGGRHGLLSVRGRAEAAFHDLKGRLRPEAHPVVDRLADLCNQRRQFAIQARLHRWLHSWLIVHFILSIALFLLMIVHTYLALRYL
ncbi:MAG: hypothetical protein ABS46_16365 [Cytophagaceae bacterium SCN 52-12]|nr:MAG: hypothetical protein ABS46_16365 [Cytophagaceae bacterium SCN 52-12]